MVTSFKAWVQQLEKLDRFSKCRCQPVEQKVIVYQKTEACDLEYEE